MSANVTAASVEFVVGDITYRISPLSDRDFGEFENWVQDRFLDVAKRNLEGLVQADRDALLKAAYETSSRLTITSPEALKLMSTVDGAAYLLYLSLRRDHPDVTFEKAKEISTNPKVLRQFMDRINELNRVEVQVKRPFGKRKKRGRRSR